MPIIWEPGDRVYEVRLGWPGTVTQVTAEYASVDLDAGCSSVYRPDELEWYTRPMSGTCNRVVFGIEASHAIAG